ncbi:MAG: DNA-protecting protein DprA [Bacteroidales bacterium]|nr:DNA-protecting protein DprA [Bacteroidales bacterium]
MRTDEENIACCALGKAFGFEPAIARGIITHLGSAKEFFRMGAGAIKEILGPYSKYRDCDFIALYRESAKELEELSKDPAFHYLHISDPAFPEALAECPDCPTGLYLKSVSEPAEIFAPGAFISVVGTRDISQYGTEWCRKIVTAMSECREKPAVVSGFALGTDITAHSAALECGLKTLAVLPTGIDSIYPMRHSTFAKRLEGTPGCALLTDYPPGTKAQPVNFLRRNRIIAGLSSATILIESKRKGGGMITADFAFGYDRGLFALPGRIDDLRSQGCNALIAADKAKAISDTGILMRDLGLGEWNRKSKLSLREEILARYGSDVADLELMTDVALTVKKLRLASADELCGYMGLDFHTVRKAVQKLENDGFLESDLLRRYSLRIS